MTKFWDTKDQRVKLISLFMGIVVILILIAIVIIWPQQARRDRDSLTKQINVTTSDDPYIQTAAAILNRFTIDDLQDDLDLSLAYAWASHALYEETHDMTSLDRMTAALHLADQLTKTHVATGYTCPLLIAIYTDDTISAETHQLAKKICFEAQFDYYRHPELAGLQSLIISSDTDNQDQSVYYAPDHIIYTVGSKIATQLTNRARGQEYTWAKDDDPSLTITHELARAQVFAALNSYYRHLHFTDPEESQDKEALIDVLNSVYLAGESLDWGLNQKVDFIPPETGIDPNDSTQCLMHYLAYLYFNSSQSANLNEQVKYAYAYYLTGHNTITCDFLAYGYQDARGYSDKDALLARAESLESLAPYEQILLAGLLASPDLTRPVSATHDEGEEESEVATNQPPEQPVSKQRAAMEAAGIPYDAEVEQAFTDQELFDYQLADYPDLPAIDYSDVYYGEGVTHAMIIARQSPPPTPIPVISVDPEVQKEIEDYYADDVPASGENDSPYLLR